MRFITDFLRQVIENGNSFSAGHFFIMLFQFSASEVANNLQPFIKVLREELHIPRDMFVQFVHGLRDDEL